MYQVVNDVCEICSFNEGRQMNGWLKDAFRSAASAFTAAPRAINDLVSGDIKDYKFIDGSKSAWDSYTDALKGKLVVTSVITGQDFLSSEAMIEELNSNQPSSQPDSIEDVPTTNTASMGTLVLGALAIGTVLTLALKKEEK